MKIGIYARKSKHDPQSDSVKNQINLCKEYCNNLVCTSINEYYDDGYTGKNTIRPDFQRLLNDIKNNKIDMILIYKFDRLCRNTKDFYSILDLLDLYNIRLKSITEDFDLNSTTGRAMAGMHSIFSQFERECISERIKDNMYELAKLGRWLGGPAPFGYKFNKVIESNKTLCYLVENDIQADVVKILYSKFIKLRSLGKVRKYAIENNINGPRGNKLDLTTLGNILRNPLYAKSSPEIVKFLQNKNMNVFGNPDYIHGFLTYGKNNSSSIQPIAAISTHKGLIDSDIWMETQKILIENNTLYPRIKTGKKALLSGLLKCKICGRNMRISSKKSSSGKELTYYICGLKKTSGTKACSCSNLNGDYIENLVLNYLNKLDVHTLLEMFKDKKLFKSNFNTESNELDMLKRNIQSKNKSLSNLVNTLSFTNDEVITKNILEKMQTISSEIQLLNYKYEELESNLNNIDTNIIENIKYWLNNFDKFLENQSLESKINFLSIVIDKIEWDSISQEVNIIFK